MTHHVANQNGLRPMRIGRAFHMDATRASDEDLERAIQTLDEYDTSGKASAMTQDKIDDRIADLNDEGDRRAGVQTVAVPRKPLSFWHPPTEPVDEDDVESTPSQRAAAISEELDDEPDESAQEQARIERLVSELDPKVTDGLVPGETSAI